MKTRYTKHTYIQARHQGGPQVPKAIVLHGTVSSDNKGTARNIALWWNGPDSPQSSAHYTVDPGEIIQSVRDNRVAYHCGSNTGSLGVEFCDEQMGPKARWSDPDSVAILERAATLVAERALAYGIQVKRPSIAALKAKGPHGIYTHNDSRLAFGNTTHTDPVDFPFDRFLDMVWAEHKRLRAEAAGVKKGATFKVLHAPLHGVSATKAEINRAFRRPGVRAINFSEAYKHIDFMRRKPLWRTITGGTRKDARGRMVARDVAISSRRDGRKKHLEHGTIQVSRQSEPLKIAPARFLSYTVDMVEGRPLAVIGIHPNAVVQKAWGSDRAAEYKKSMRKLAALVRLLRIRYGKNLDIVVLGDLNYRNVDDRRYWAPRQVFARLDLAYVARGLDWVAWSKSLKRVRAVEVSRELNGQDHPWIEVELSQA